MTRNADDAVDAYLAAQPPPTRSVLERVRATLRKALPGATERISYRIPVFELDGVMVLYFAGFQRHCSIYPATPRVVGTLGAALTPFLHGRGTIRFPLDEAVPTRLVTRIAKVRAAEAAERARAKAERRVVARRPRPGARKKPAPARRREPEATRARVAAKSPRATRRPS